MHGPINIRRIQKFLDSIDEIRRIFATSEVWTDPLKAFSGCSFCVSPVFCRGFIFHDFSDLSSQEVAFCHSYSANAGKCFYSGTGIIFEFVLAVTFTKHLRFFVERRKEYLRVINDRNVVDPVFSRLMGLPRFPDKFDELPGCRVTIPKASVVGEFSKDSLHSHQNVKDLQISTDVSSVNIILHCLQKYFYVIRSFL